MNPRLQLLDDAIRAIQRQDVINSGIGAAVGYGGAHVVNAIAGQEIVNPLLTGGVGAVANPLVGRYLKENASKKWQQQAALTNQRSPATQPQPQAVTITPKYREETAYDLDFLSDLDDVPAYTSKPWPQSSSYMSSDELDEFMMM